MIQGLGGDLESCLHSAVGAEAPLLPLLGETEAKDMLLIPGGSSDRSLALS